MIQYLSRLEEMDNMKTETDSEQLQKRIAKSRSKKKCACLLALSMMLQGCQNSVILGMFQNEIKNDRNQFLTTEQIDNLMKTISNNTKLSMKEKEIIEGFCSVIELLPNINYEQTNERFADLDIIDKKIPKNSEFVHDVAYWYCDKNLIEIDNWNAIYHELGHVLSGGNNGSFFEEGIPSLLSWELQGYRSYPEYIIITQMFCEMFGSDFMIKSFLSSDNLLKEKIGSIVDPEFANAFFTALDDYHEKYRNRKTHDDQVRTQRALNLIINYIEIIYSCYTNVELDYNNLSRTDLEPEQIDELNTILDYQYDLTFLKLTNQVPVTHYFNQGKEPVLVLKK